MKKVYLLAVLATALFACHHSDDSDEPTLEEAFENLNDLTTTEVQTTIPRLELAQSNNKLMVFLSVTNQVGVPLEQFTLGNYTVQMTVNGGTPEIIAQNRITLSEFDQSNNNPLAIAATMDYSGSMDNSDIIDMETALKSFIGLKDPNDLMSIIKFASTIREVQGFTTNPSLLQAAVDQNSGISGLTAFYGACDLGLDKVNELDNIVPVVIGFTDGYDSALSISQTDLIAKSRALSIPIYTVGFGSADQIGLQFLADETGGRFFYAPSSEDIMNLYTLLNQQLRKLYILEWTVNYPSGTEIILEITTQYTAGNGTFTDVSIKTITIE